MRKQKSNIASHAVNYSAIEYKECTVLMKKGVAIGETLSNMNIMTSTFII